MAPVNGSVGRVGNAGKAASGVAAQPARKRLILGALFRCTPKGLAKLGEVGEAHCRQANDFPGLGRYADPPFEAGFAISGSSFAASRKWSRARSGFRAHGERAPGFRGEQPGKPPNGINSFKCASRARVWLSLPG